MSTLKLTKTDTKEFDQNDECSACGKMLKQGKHAWLGFNGTYCSKPCAEQHDIDLRDLACDTPASL